MPTPASIINTTTSALKIASTVLIAAYLSRFSYILPRFFKPAVSITVYFLPSLVNLVSIVSRVVPSISDTISLFSFKIAFVNDDLPTFGLPINANLIESSSSKSLSSSSESESLSSSESSSYFFLLLPTLLSA